jgi:ubiquinone biosynthesis protein COQ4
MKPKFIVSLFYHLYRGIREPENVQHSIRVGNVLTASGAIQPAVDKIKALPGGADLFARRSLPYGQSAGFFAQFMPGTFGNAYYQYLTQNKLDPSVFPMVKMKNDGDFLENHVRQTHDILHVATGFDVSEIGELGLQAFKAKQFHWPFALVAFAGASLLFLFKDPRKMEALVDSWARGHRLAVEMVPLILVDWNELWALPMAEVQQKLRKV